MSSLKRIAILGSTGSIGLNTLKVVDRFPGRFKVVALTAYNNVGVLRQQIRKYVPKCVAVSQNSRQALIAGAQRSLKVFDVERDLDQIVSLPEVDVVVIGMRGAAALGPFLKAAQCGKMIAPANKEALVMAGDLLMREARKHGATIIPVDSEQSAIFQCLQGQSREVLKYVHLTASGGPLNKVPQARFNKLSVQEILKHPRWKMGPKITVDSATLMNKGFEFIEAQKLFQLRADQIKVVVHPEAIIHSMVEFTDGSIIAQLGATDMRLPIQYALTYPERLDTGLKQLDFAQLGQLNFSAPDLKKFPALALAMHAAKKGGTLPCVLNAADEEAVDAFLNHRIKFTQIYSIVEKVVLKHRIASDLNLKEIYQSDQWARQEARKWIK